MPGKIPLSLYIHIPWCVRKCPYCDFNSHGLKPGQTADDLPEAEYVAALLADLDQDLYLIGDRPLTSIFIGGGTPSLFSPKAIRSLLDGVRSRIAFTDEIEITLEANPGTVEQSRFEGYRAAGINRLSMGVQSFNAKHLFSLGRIHSGDEAAKAAKAARAAGFDNFNLDLMYALPSQTLAQAKEDIAKAIAQSPSHISHYQLTLEPNTLFHQKPPSLPDDDSAWEMQEACQQMLADAGYQHYEVSAYAKGGNTAKHNLNYWWFGDYLGIGAGAHAKISTSKGVLRQWKQRLPAKYLETAATEKVRGGESFVEIADLPFEFMLNSLRLQQPMTWQLFEQRAGVSKDLLLPKLNLAVEKGFIDFDDERLTVTELGQRFQNDLLVLFMP
ncbi:MAG: putative oxygen-independent coproporphyrinogen III oxidase [Gammaproteobacteria bacterium]|jgi:putative oxygen-independent coproporphyrinogen III oxidase